MDDRMIKWYEEYGFFMLEMPGDCDGYTLDRDQLRQLLKDGRHALSEQFAKETGKVKQ